MKYSKHLVGVIVGLGLAVVSQWPSRNLRMVVCDVGQGDAIVLIDGFSQVLIDGGESGQKVLSCLRRHLPFWDRRIEVVMMTNSDADHSGGLGDVIDRYDLMYFVTGEGLQNTDTLLRLARVVRENGVQVVGVREGDRVKVGKEGEVVINVLWPNELKSEKVAIFREQLSEQEAEQILGESATRGDINELSLVSLVEWRGVRILLTGDAGEETERKLIESGLLTDVDVLKVGHHGSKYSSSLEFLRVIKPEIAIISVGKNSYGHPTSEALGRLQEAGARVMRTDQDGDVVVDLKDR